MNNKHQFSSPKLLENLLATIRFYTIFSIKDTAIYNIILYYVIIFKAKFSHLDHTLVNNRFSTLTISTPPHHSQNTPTQSTDNLN